MSAHGLTDSETLHALPYLDKVIHECLRLETPIPLTVRIATRDTMLPLENPVVGRNGKVMESFRVKKGDMINIREVCSHHPK
jgi:cytochrome P450